MSRPRKTIAVIVGTRPEAIKMAPVYRALTEHKDFAPVLIGTGQHTDLLQTALAAFDLKTDRELKVETPTGTLSAGFSRMLEGMDHLLSELRPAAVLVQGDTTTALAAGLAAFYAKVPVGHVEAGLRTYDFENPFPEEAHRQLLDRLSTWCFPPTELSKQHLLAERIDLEKIHVTGNTGIDALLWALERSRPAPTAEPFVLVTLHRRESFGEPLRSVLLGLLDFLVAVPEAHAVWPIHRNPAVGAIAQEVLAGQNRVCMIEPQAYLGFVGSMATCRVILSDSGGVQEEAPSLGKRVLVARDTTERPEAVDTGQNWLVGRERQRVSEALLRAWNEPPYRGPIPAKSPYGDGQASQRLVEILSRTLAP